MSFFQNFLSQVKDVAQKSKESINQAIDNLSQQDSNKYTAVILPWERDDLEDETKQWIKNETFQLSLIHTSFLQPPEKMPKGFSVSLVDARDFVSKLLLQDPNLNPTQFFLVPEFITEELFWKHYFARLYLLVDAAEKQDKELKAAKQARKEQIRLPPPPLKTHGTSGGSRAAGMHPFQLPVSLGTDRERDDAAEEDPILNELEKEIVSLKQSKKESTKDAQTAPDVQDDGKEKPQTQKQTTVPFFSLSAVTPSSSSSSSSSSTSISTASSSSSSLSSSSSSDASSADKTDTADDDDDAVDDLEKELREAIG